MGERRFYEFGPYRLDATGHLLFRGGEPVPLTPKAADTLLLLVENAGQVVEKEQLLKAVWQDAFVEEGSLTRTISVLRKALEDGGDGQEYIATISKRGYRFVGAVTIAEASSPSTSAIEHEPVTKARRPTTILVLALVITAMAVLAYFPARRFWERSHSRSQKTMLAVLPFENLTGDPAQEFLADGLTEEMITQLASLNHQQLGVIARTSAMTYKGSSRPVDQIGRELGVNYILEGSVRSWGKRVRISAQLVQVSDQTHLWAESYERDSQDILALQSDVARAIAREIDVTLTPHANQQVAGRPPVNPEAYQNYLRGRYFWYKRTQEALTKSIEYFDQAIAQDPSYAAAYVGRSDAYLMLAGRGFVPAKEVMPGAMAAARKALELNGDLGEAHASLAHARLHAWEWQDLDEEFKRAIQLNPAHAFAYYYYAEYLMAAGRSEESINIVKKVQEIDPVSPILATTLPSQYYFARNYEPAADLLRKALELNPDFFLLHFRLSQVYTQQGKNDEAIAEMQKAVTLSGRTTETLAGLAQAYAGAGKKGPMQEIVDELNRRSRQHYVQPYYVAKIYASAGDKEKTFQWLERAYGDRSIDLIELNIEPAFDSVRSDPRFADLLRRVGWRG